MCQCLYNQFETKIIIIIMVMIVIIVIMTTRIVRIVDGLILHIRV